jgi:hypothetical protein
MTDTSFIIIDSIIGQYTIDFCTPDLTFFVLKKFAVERSWDHIKGDTKCYYPVLSTSADDQDISKYIQEDLTLEHYHLERGGCIFIHYIDVNFQLENYGKSR